MPDEITNLVARLRADRAGQATAVACDLDDLCIEAADEIERLRAEIANLNRGLNKVRERGLAWQKDAVERVRAINAERCRNV